MTTQSGPSKKYLNPPESFRIPGRPHRVIGDLYAVGTTDLGIFFIATDEGHILINTGIQDSDALIRRNMEVLGFDLRDVKILLSMQSHWDHTGALAAIQRETGADMVATRADARILQDGGWSDPHFGGSEMFEPVKVDHLVVDGDVVSLGGVDLTVHEHRGHTEGSSSYTFQVEEGGRRYDVAIVNMATINAGKRLLVDPTYPGVADDFAETFAKQKQLDVDVWVAAHASHYRLQDKLGSDDEYRPDRFVDPSGLRAAVERLEQKYLQQLENERAQLD